MSAISLSLLFIFILGQFLSCSTPARNAYIKGLGLQDAGRYVEALEYYEKGLKYEPDSPLLNFRKGECLAKLQRWKEAKETFEKFMQITEKDASSWQEERWEAEFYIKKATQELGEDKKDEENKPDEKEDRFAEDEGSLGGISIVTR